MTRDGRTKVSLTPPGAVQVTPGRDGWYFVQITRAKYVKRFNLSRAEAAELARVLTTEVLTADRPPR
jgi:hypothetical protein